MQEQPPISVLHVGGALEAHESLLEAAGFALCGAPDSKAALERIHNDPPGILVLPYAGDGIEAHPLLLSLRSDNLYGRMPIVLTLTEADLSRGVDWEALPCDDYLVTPAQEGELLSRLRLAAARVQREMDANPLTGLPGNITIMREAERRLASGEPFAVAYLDLDHFKPFNDRYGFIRGDEVLRMTARIMLNAIRSLRSPNTYVGHVGGDDFIFITPVELVEQACKRVLADFDHIILNFYDEEDRIAGAISSEDRQGRPRRFPIMSCSIAVVDAGQSAVDHIGDISARAAEVKRFAKGLPGSNYIIDRRR